MRLARNSLYSLGGSAVPLAVSFATIPLFIAQIGAERYGALALAWLVLGYFGAADFGIGRAITQRIAAIHEQSPAAKADAVWSALVSIIAFSLLASAIIYLFAYWYFAGVFRVDEGLRGEMVSAVWVLALCNPVVAVNGVLSGALMGLERFRLVALSNVISNTGLLVLPLAVSYFVSVDLKLLIAASLAARVIGLIMLAVVVWREFLQGQRAGFSRDEFNRLANFGAWIMVSSLVGPLMVYADRFLIGIALDAVAVAAYTIPFQVAYRTLLVPGAISQALFPRFASELEEGARLRCSEFAAFIGQSFAPIVIALICLAEPLLQLWLGDLLDPRSIMIGQVLLLGCWANAIALFPLAFLQARGLPRFTAKLHVAELPFYLALLWWLGSQFGLIGFAAAFSIRYAVDCLLLLAKSRLRAGLLAQQLLPPALLVAAAMLSGVMLEGVMLKLAAATILSIAAGIISITQMPVTLRPGFANIPYIGRLLAPVWK